MQTRLDGIQDDQKIILTTEKDAVRLMKFSDKIEHLPFFVLPISIMFLFSQEQKFAELIRNYPKNFYGKKEQEERI
jgi:tetraacyldisaccharide 4'-kinase